ncbi:2-methylaconitate cis-trans isomerase PrpF family protein [Hydrogenophaga palleronii]|uniref:2-methylaconitate cis-trans isomerase PrpF family protein n=1 Tax=Hydrogenophaga palleronii TaxID=65655 RepID=UPI0008268DCF|nr:PrpF domain-containing protein [Hydrogenophaga palleronii]
MGQRYRAAFIRGGTSKAIVFRLEDLPADRAAWDAIFLRAMGTPDRYGRQLNGMGGGVSSLSKVCVVGPATVEGADVDYTFAQVQIREARVDYSGNCGNMSSSIGPFAIDERLLPTPPDGPICVRIHNTNTRKIIHAHFEVRDGQSVEAGTLEIPGVDGPGAPVRLDFLSPGGASTGRLLPTGSPLDELQTTALGATRASLVDAANACVFVPAAAVGLVGTELPDEIAAHPTALEQLKQLRLAASVAMGISASLEEAAAKPMIPLIAIVSPPADSITLDGERIAASQVDLVVRMISSGQPHRALPLTGSLCTAVAMQIEGTVVHEAARAERDATALRLAMPSGVLTVAAKVSHGASGWHADSGCFYRTTRRLFDGHVYA